MGVHMCVRFNAKEDQRNRLSYLYLLVCTQSKNDQGVCKHFCIQHLNIFAVAFYTVLPLKMVKTCANLLLADGGPTDNNKPLS